MSISQNFPSTRPSLNLNFARSKTLDPRITFTRTSTGTYVDENGLVKIAPANSPRFDHDPATGECLGLLIEEQRANLCTQSSNFNFSSTDNITETDVFNPDGTAALRRVPLSTGNFHGTGADAANIDISGLADGATTSVTTSIFVKNYNNSNLRLLIGFAAYDGTTYRYFLTTIDTANPTSVGIPVSTGWSNGAIEIENYSNGWYRYSFSGTYTKATGYNTVAFVGEQIYSSTGQQFWFGDDVSGIYIWGKQREVGLFSTSYIPTSGSTATRTADNASMVGENFSDWYNPNEGTFCTNFRTELNITNNIWSVNNYPTSTFGTVLNYFRLLTLSNTIHTQYNVAGTNLYPTFPLSSNNYQKTVQSYDVNSSPIISAVNGTLGTGAGNIYGTSPNFIQLEFGKNSDNRNIIGQYTISQLTYHPARLSNSQLQTLTK